MTKTGLAPDIPTTEPVDSKEDARYARGAEKAITGGIREIAHLLSDETRLRETEVAVLLSMSPATLRNRRALNNPILPYERVSGGTVRYRWGTVREALKARTESPSSPAAE